METGDGPGLYETNPRQCENNKRIVGRQVYKNRHSLRIILIGTLDACPKKITSTKCILVYLCKGRPYGTETNKQRVLTINWQLDLLTRNIIIVDANAFFIN